MSIPDAASTFPCPFCQSPHVILLGSGMVFLHYKCSECLEVWTAMAAKRPAFLRPHVAPRTRRPTTLPRAPRRQKVWPH